MRPTSPRSSARSITSQEVLAELAPAIEAEHQAVRRIGEDLLDRAMRLGDLLLDAKRLVDVSSIG